MKKKLLFLLLILPITSYCLSGALLNLSAGICMSLIKPFIDYTKSIDPEKDRDHLHAITFRAPTNPIDDQPLVRINSLVNAIHDDYDEIPEGVLISFKDARPPLQIHRGIASVPSDTVTIYSRGFATATKPKTRFNLLNSLGNAPKRGGGCLVAYSALRDRTITNVPCISFDYPDTKSSFAFGQEVDYLHRIFDATLQLHPAGIVAYGGCRGAKSWLLLLSSLPDEQLAAVKCLILESPLTTVQELTTYLAQKIKAPFFSPFIIKLLDAYFDQFQPDNDDLFGILQHKKFPFPILIGHAMNDPVIADSSIAMLCQTLISAGNTVYLAPLQSNNSTIGHAKLSKSAAFQACVNNLYKQESLSYEPDLAAHDADILSRAAQNAHNDSKAWDFLSS